MNDEDRQTWSRHYDVLQWAVITIVSAGVGTLVAASFNASTKDQLWPEIAGLALTILGVSYVASFRIFRKQLHQAIADPDLRAFLNNPGGTRCIKQWVLFVGSLLVVDVVLIYRLVEKGHVSCVVGSILLLAMTLILGAIWASGKGASETQANNARNGT